MTIRELPPLSWLQNWRMPGRVDWRAEVSAYVDGELSASETAQLEARLAQSAELRAYLDELRSFDAMLRSTAVKPAASTLQLSPDLLSVRLQPDDAGPLGWRRAPALAAVKVATVAAIAALIPLLIFDVVNPPTVQYAQTSANDVMAESASVPTTSVTTRTVEVSSSATSDTTQSSAESSAEPQATVAAVERQTEARADQASPTAEPAESAEQAEQAETAAVSEASAQQSSAVATQTNSDPSRRALTSARAGDSESGSGTARQVVTASAVLASDDTAESEQASAATSSAENWSDESSSAHDGDAAAGATQADARDDDQAEPETAATTTVRVIEVTESDSSENQASSYPVLAGPREPRIVDPSWEWPLQIALGAIAIGSALAWLLMHIWFRRAA